MLQEHRLVINSPHLHFRMRNGKNGKTYTLLLSSDYERINWRDSIVGLKCKGKQKAAILDKMALICIECFV